MKYPFFASFIILILVIRHAIRRNRNLDESSRAAFWEKERLANETRKKPLDDLIYITPDTSAFPMDVMQDNEEIADCKRIIEELKNEKIVNLTGITNTDLKLKYGVANLPALTSYDDRFTLLVQTYEKWADILWENGHVSEAVPILEEQVRIRADVASVYKKLASYYKENGQSEKIPHLHEVADTLNPTSRSVILRYLDEI